MARAASRNRIRQLPTTPTAAVGTADDDANRHSSAPEKPYSAESAGNSTG
jgi:hypothetical protein